MKGFSAKCCLNSSSTIYLFFWTTRVNIVRANRIIWALIWVGQWPFLFVLFPEIPSTRLASQILHTFCLSDASQDIYTSHFLDWSFNLRSKNDSKLVIFLHSGLQTAAVCLRALCRDTWPHRVRPCTLLFVIFWSAEMIIILPHAPLITNA